MEDAAIVELYFDRDEQAIAETAPPQRPERLASYLARRCLWEWSIGCFNMQKSLDNWVTSLYSISRVKKHKGGDTVRLAAPKQTGKNRSVTYNSIAADRLAKNPLRGC